MFKLHIVSSSLTEGKTTVTSTNKKLKRLKANELNYYKESELMISVSS